MTCIGYVRVSSREQGDSGLGIEAQRRALLRSAELRGLTLDRIEVEVASGGTAKDRPVFLSVCEELDAEGGGGVLLATKIDRVARSTADFANTLDRAQRHGWAVVVLDIDVDTSTAMGKLVANVIAAVAQFEREITGERTREALAVAKARGVRLGRPVLDACVRERIVRMREEGSTLQSIADTLTQEGVPTARGGKWYPSTVRGALHAHVRA